MIDFDIIIVSNAKNCGLHEMTYQCIKNCLNSDKNVNFNIYVIEQQKDKNYKNAYTIHYRFPFNYNKCLNLGLNKSDSEYIGFFNNDVIFKKNWAINIVNAMGSKYLSASPISNNKCGHNSPYIPGDGSINEGYQIGHEILGWAIVTKRILWTRYLDKFDESCNFWYSDNTYAHQLKLNNIKHILVTDSIVDHKHNKTIINASGSEKSNYMHKQQQNFEKFKKNYKVNNNKSIYTFSVIMPSFLGNYRGAAKEREKKIKRALKSLLNQDYKDFEVIIISDNCNKTNEIYLDNYYKYNPNVTKDVPHIKCFEIDKKQKTFSGNVRKFGIEKALGEYIIYLDIDDFYKFNHLSNIKKQLKKFDWVYFDNVLPSFNSNKNFHEIDEFLSKPLKIKNVKLGLGSSGTSSICHKRDMHSTWNNCDGYAHDWMFIEKLMNESSNYVKIKSDGYIICHQPSQWDY